jgi:two-component system, cell cycle response regulator DivK
MSRPLVCVIEDYPDSRVLILAVLSNAGMEVVTAESGAELDVVLAAGREPNLFLIDLSLPGEDGTSILRRLRLDARFKHTPMVALTAHAMAGEAERGRAAGFDDYITKPIDITTLPARLSGFVRNGGEELAR